MKYQLFTVLPWWFKNVPNFIRRRKPTHCTDLYKFEDETWTESDRASEKDEAKVVSASGVEHGHHDRVEQV